jgi:hypothetical protein
MPRLEHRVVERVDEDASRLLDELEKPLVRLGGIRRGEIDLCAVAPRRLHLERVRRAPHEDGARDARLARRERGPLRGVPGRPGHDPAGLLLVRERRDLVQHSSRLERAGLLEQLGLEMDVCAERAAREGRRAVKTPADDVAGPLDVGLGRSPFDRTVRTARMGVWTASRSDRFASSSATT